MNQSPTPPAPSAAELQELEDQERNDRVSSPTGPKLSAFSSQQITQSNVPWVPKETDSSALAADWRARRALRIALDGRETMGRPTMQGVDGSVRKASGVWFTIERHAQADAQLASQIKLAEDRLTAQLKAFGVELKELTDEHAAAKKSREDLTGFVKTRAERVFDKVLWLILAAGFGYFTRHIWLPAEHLPAAAPPGAVAPSPEKH